MVVEVMMAAGTTVLVVLVVIMLLKGVCGSSCSKASKQARLVERNVALFQMLATGAGGRVADISPKACPTSAEKQGVRAF